MPSPNGVITISSDIKRSLKTEKTTCALAVDALVESLVTDKLAQMQSTVDKDNIKLTKRAKSTSFQPCQDIQKF